MSKYNVSYCPSFLFRIISLIIFLLLGMDSAFAANCEPPTLKIIGDALITKCSTDKGDITWNVEQTNSAAITDIEWYYRYNETWYLMGAEKTLSVTVPTPDAPEEFLVLAYNGNCVSDSIIFKVDVKSPIYSNRQNNRLYGCEGSTAYWTLNIDQEDSLTYYFGNDPNGYRDTFFFYDVRKDTIISYYATNGYCVSEIIHDTIDIEKLTHVTLSAATHKVCQGDSVELIATVDSPNQPQLYWMKWMQDEDEPVFVGTSLETSIKVKVSEASDFLVAVAPTQVCPMSLSDIVTVDVERLELGQKEYPDSLCYYEPVVFEGLVLEGEPTTYRWEKNGKKLDEFDGMTTITANERPPLNERNNTKHTDYYDFIVTGTLCQADTIRFKINVDGPKYIVCIPLENTVCEGERPNFRIEGAEIEDLNWYRWILGKEPQEFDYYNDNWDQLYGHVGYQVKLKEQKMCYYEYSNPFSVYTEKKPSFGLRDESNCGSEVTMKAYCDDDYPYVEWRKNGETISHNIIATDVLSGTAMYVFEARGKVCPATIDSIEISAGKQDMIITVDNSKPCEGEKIHFELDAMEGFAYKDLIWEKKNEKDDDYHTFDEGAPFGRDIAESGATLYRLKGKINNCETNPIPIKVEAINGASLNIEDMKICETGNATVTLPSNITFDYVEWFIKGDDTTPVNTGATFETNPDKPTTTYRVEVHIEDCTFKDEFTIYVEEKPRVTLEEIPPTICEGESVTLKATVDGNASTVEWRKNGNVIANNAITSDIADEDAVYEFEAKHELCPSAIENVYTTVSKKENIEISANQVACEDEIEIKLLNSNFQVVNLEYYQPSTDEFITFQNSIGIDEWRMYPDISPITIQLTGVDANGCDGIPMPVTIDMTPSVKGSLKDRTICEGEVVISKLDDKFENVEWYKEDETTPFATGNTLEIIPTSTSSYTVNAQVGECTTTEEFTLTIVETPQILSHTMIDNRSCQFEVNVSTPVYFSYNGKEKTTSDIIKVWQGKTYNVEVSNEFGCSSTYTFTTPTLDLTFPLYFYQGEENWVIGNLESYDNYTLFIYDRFGKLLYQVDNDVSGWDGVYLGHKMPSTDYWYVLDVHILDKQYTGHFTLMRK